jgi:hypothetical protein
MPEPWEDGDQQIDREEIRARLKKLFDIELAREGRAARQLAKGANGKPGRKVFVVTLEECRAEWRARHPTLYHDSP